MNVQAQGVADALGVNVTFKQVNPTGVWRAMAPWGPVSPLERFAREGSQFAPPWPDVAIATGRLSIPYMRAIGRVAGGRTFRVVLQDPKTSASIADLIWVPAHDTRRGANVFTTLAAAHSFSPARIAAMRSTVPPEIASLAGPRVAVILGGPNAVYRYSERSLRDIKRRLSQLARHAGSFLVTPSRRTPGPLIEAVREATNNVPHIFWDFEGENPYPQFLAQADMLVVTADSVNMTGEACATGRPVYVFEPDGGSAKFSRFHDALRRYGATRELPAAAGQLETWSYQPLHCAADIAREIERRWQALRAPGPPSGR